MPIDRRRLLQVVAIFGAVCAYATIVVGGTVRGMNAGLACPDWPLCNGSVVPNLADTGILVEYIHRLVAALTGIFMLSTLIAAVLWFRPEMRIITLSVMSFAILGRKCHDCLGERLGRRHDPSRPRDRDTCVRPHRCAGLSLAREGLARIPRGVSLTRRRSGRG